MPLRHSLVLVLLALAALLGCVSGGNRSTGDHVDVSFSLMTRDAVRPRLSLHLAVSNGYEADAPLQGSTARQIRGSFSVPDLPRDVPLVFTVQVIKQGVNSPLLQVILTRSLDAGPQVIVVNDELKDELVGSTLDFYRKLLEVAADETYYVGRKYCIDDTDCPGSTCSAAGLCGGTACGVDTGVMYAPLDEARQCYDWLTLVPTCDALGLGAGALGCSPDCAIDVSHCAESCAGIGQACTSDHDCCGPATCDRVCRYGDATWRPFATLAPPAGWNSLVAFLSNSIPWFGRSVEVGGSAGKASFTLQTWAGKDSASESINYVGGSSITLMRGKGCLVADGLVHLPCGGTAALPSDAAPYGLACDACAAALVDAAGVAHVWSTSSGDWLPGVTVRSGVALHAAALRGDALWAVGDGGTVGRVTVSTGSVAVVASSGASLRSVFADATGAWAVGDDGAVVACRGDACQAAASGVTTTLRDAWGDGHEVWAVGDGGTIVSFREEVPASSFVDESAPALGDLVAVAGSNLHELGGYHLYAPVYRGVEVFALSANGELYRRVAPDVWP